MKIEERIAALGYQLPEADGYAFAKAAGLDILAAVRPELGTWG